MRRLVKAIARRVGPARRPQAQDGPLPLTPEARRRSDDLAGSPVALADGREWILAAHVPDFGPVWDELYDTNNLRGEYDPEHICVAAYKLLLANYAMSEAEGVGLIARSDLAAFVEPVESAMFGPPMLHRTWNGWRRASFWANGIDPDLVPPGECRESLAILVLSGRTVPQADYISSASAGVTMRSFKAIAEAQAAERDAAAKAAAERAAEQGTPTPPEAPTSGE